MQIINERIDVSDIISKAHFYQTAFEASEMLKQILQPVLKLKLFGYSMNCYPVTYGIENRPNDPNLKKPDFEELTNRLSKVDFVYIGAETKSFDDNVISNYYLKFQHREDIVLEFYTSAFKSPLDMTIHFNPDLLDSPISTPPRVAASNAIAKTYSGNFSLIMNLMRG